MKPVPSCARWRKCPPANFPPCAHGSRSLCKIRNAPKPNETLQEKYFARNGQASSPEGFLCRLFGRPDAWEADSTEGANSDQRQQAASGAYFYVAPRNRPFPAAFQKPADRSEEHMSEL